MINYLISEAIGDIAGSAYEGRTHRIKDYNKLGCIFVWSSPRNMPGL